MVDDEGKDTQDWKPSDFIPIRDALAGETEADNFGHAIVRTAFLGEIWNDEQVQALVSRWAQRTGLEERAIRLARAGDRLAKLAGLVRMRPDCLPGLVSRRTLRFSFKCQLPSLLQLRHRERNHRISRGTDEVVAEWQRLLDEGVVKNRAELARRMGVSRARITRALAHT